MTLINTLEGFVLSIPAFFSNALQAFTTFIQKTTGISPADLHHILRWTGIFLFAFLLFLILKRLYHLWLPGHFARRYGISRLPKHTIIKRRFVCRLREILMFFVFRPGDMPMLTGHAISAETETASIGKTAVL